MPGCEIVKYSLQVDHVHIVMVIPPKYAVSDVVARMKQRTSSELRKKFDWLGRRYWKENHGAIFLLSDNDYKIARLQK